MNAEPQQEHHWLDKLVGEWTYEGECIMSPGQPPLKNQGVEVVRSLGGLWTLAEGELWTLAEGEGKMPEGGTAKTIMTLGYDPHAKRYVGTFIVSIMAHLWTYDGSLDESGRVIELDAEGPSFTGEGTGKYRDSIEFVNDDHRVLRSQALGEDGQWHLFMTANYRRKS